MGKPARLLALFLFLPNVLWAKLLYSPNENYSKQVIREVIDQANKTPPTADYRKSVLKIIFAGPENQKLIEQVIAKNNRQYQIKWVLTDKSLDFFVKGRLAARIDEIDVTKQTYHVNGVTFYNNETSFKKHLTRLYQASQKQHALWRLNNLVFPPADAFDFITSIAAGAAAYNMSPTVRQAVTQAKSPPRPMAHGQQEQTFNISYNEYCSQKIDPDIAIGYNFRRDHLIVFEELLFDENLTQLEKCPQAVEAIYQKYHVKMNITPTCEDPDRVICGKPLVEKLCHQGVEVRNKCVHGIHKVDSNPPGATPEQTPPANSTEGPPVST